MVQLTSDPASKLQDINADKSAGTGIAPGEGEDVPDSPYPHILWL
jgi:hypothetical protein